MNSARHSGIHTEFQHSGGGRGEGQGFEANKSELSAVRDQEVEHLPSFPEALGLTCSPQNKERQRG